MHMIGWPEDSLICQSVYNTEKHTRLCWQNKWYYLPFIKTVSLLKFEILKWGILPVFWTGNKFLVASKGKKIWEKNQD